MSSKYSWDDPCPCGDHGSAWEHALADARHIVEVGKAMVAAAEARNIEAFVLDSSHLAGHADEIEAMSAAALYEWRRVDPEGVARRTAEGMAQAMNDANMPEAVRDLVNTLKEAVNLAGGQIISADASGMVVDMTNAASQGDATVTDLLEQLEAFANAGKKDGDDDVPGFYL
jgi:hypothetical protein